MLNSGLIDLISIILVGGFISYINFKLSPGEAILMTGVLSSIIILGLVIPGRDQLVGFTVLAVLMLSLSLRLLYNLIYSRPPDPQAIPEGEVRISDGYNV